MHVAIPHGQVVPLCRKGREPSQGCAAYKGTGSCQLAILAREQCSHSQTGVRLWGGEVLCICMPEVDGAHACMVEEGLATLTSFAENFRISTQKLKLNLILDHLKHSHTQ